MKLVQTAATGPLLSYKLKPAEGWKLATEASLRSRTLAGSMTFKALKGECVMAACSCLQRYHSDNLDCTVTAALCIDTVAFC